MSKASAFRRMTAARLARKVPETLQLLRSGQLCLTTLCLLREVLTPERASELLSLAANRSEEQVKVLVASLRPQASPTQGVRKLPTRGGALPAPESPSSGAKLAARAHGCAGPEPAQSTATPGAESPALAQRSAPSPLASPEPPSPRATLRPLDAKRHALRMLVDASFMAELQEARQLLSHQIPSGDLLEVVRQCVRIAVRTQRQRRRGADRPRSRRQAPAGAQASSSQNAAPHEPGSGVGRAPEVSGRASRAEAGTTEPGRSRHLPAELRRTVWARDQGRCTFVGNNGQRCSESRQLEFHHEQAFSTGGAHSARNLRLCCSSHHGLLTERAFGADFVARYRSSARTVAGVPPSVPNNLQSEDACSQPSAVPRGPRDFLIRVEIHRPTGNV